MAPQKQSSVWSIRYCIFNSRSRWPGTELTTVEAVGD